MPGLEVFVGTSGWLYDWNEEATFDWYVEESGLNAVELNASFYRFPFRNQVASWARKGRGLRWAVKVHRSITHLRKLGEKAVDTWRKFADLFKPLDPIVDFYLFQLPPNFSCSEEGLERVASFYRATGLGSRFAVEFRHESCFRESTVEWARGLGLTLVSIDAPIATWVVSSNGIVYLRLHGKGEWYGYEYSEGELAELARAAMSLKPSKVYAFFNNDHWMLENARKMLEILRAGAKGLVA